MERLVFAVSSGPARGLKLPDDTTNEGYWTLPGTTGDLDLAS